MKSLITYSKTLKWISFVLAGIFLVVRFLYGKNNEFDANGDFQLTNKGIVLTIIAVLFVILGLAFDFLNSFKKK
ncbi:MAG: hypothetical protein FJZ67_02770 [Bacteroidetes bacterium]|nr:hypothetical protein [Bacteroidota bacterium]